MSHIYLEKQSPSSVGSSQRIPSSHAPPQSSPFIIIILARLCFCVCCWFPSPSWPTISIIAPNCKSGGMISIRRSGYTCCKNVALRLSVPVCGIKLISLICRMEQKRKGLRTERSGWIPNRNRTRSLVKMIIKTYQYKITANSRSTYELVP